LSQILAKNSPVIYNDISHFFVEDIIILIDKIKKSKDFAFGDKSTQITVKNENINITQISKCINLFFKEIFTFLGKKIEYEDIIITK
jgi:hypothetical protein